MAGTDIGWLGLAASLVLVAAAVVVSRTQRLRLEREIVVACGRGVAQLAVVGWGLAIVLSDTTPLIWAWTWSGVIVVLASRTVHRRAPQLPGILQASLVGNGGCLVVSFLVAFGLGIFPVEARVIVPVTGMIVGNAMKTVVVVSKRLEEEVADRRLELEARLALGWSGMDAIRPAVRAGLRLGLLPTIENVRGLGLIFLPGAMTGLILAGVDPQHAVLVQLALMFLILGAAALAATTVALITARRLFTADLRPVPILRLATDEGR